MSNSLNHQINTIRKKIYYLSLFLKNFYSENKDYFNEISNNRNFNFEIQHNTPELIKEEIKIIKYIQQCKNGLEILENELEILENTQLEIFYLNSLQSHSYY